MEGVLRARQSSLWQLLAKVSQQAKLAVASLHPLENAIQLLKAD
jgi:hypothetical protein